MKLEFKKFISYLLITSALSAIGSFLFFSNQKTIIKNAKKEIFDGGLYFSFIHDRIDLQKKIDYYQFIQLLKNEIIYLNTHKKTSSETPILQYLDFKLLPFFFQINKNIKVGIKKIKADDYQNWKSLELELWVYEEVNGNFNEFYRSATKLKITNFKEVSVPHITNIRTDGKNLKKKIYAGKSLNSQYVNDANGISEIDVYQLNEYYKNEQANSFVFDKQSGWMAITNVTNMKITNNIVSFDFNITRLLRVFPDYVDKRFVGLGLEEIFFNNPIKVISVEIEYDLSNLPPAPPPVEPPIDNDNSVENPDGNPTPPPVGPEPQPEPNPDPTPPTPMPPENDETGQSGNSDLSTKNKMTLGLVFCLISASIMFLTILLFVTIFAVKFDSKD